MSLSELFKKAADTPSEKWLFDMRLLEASNSVRFETPYGDYIFPFPAEADVCELVKETLDGGLGMSVYVSS